MAFHLKITPRSDRALLFWLPVIAVPFAGYLIHLIHCIAAGRLLFVVVGAVVPPVATVHGIGLWFGA